MNTDFKAVFVREQIDRVKAKYWYLMEKENNNERKDS